MTNLILYIEDSVLNDYCIIKELILNVIKKLNENKNTVNVNY
jgi:hypothetical protein